MIKIFAGNEYWVDATGVDRVVRQWGKKQGGEFIKVEPMARRTFLAALHKVDDLTARLACSDVAGDFCLIDRMDISQLERALA